MSVKKKKGLVAAKSSEFHSTLIWLKAIRSSLYQFSQNSSLCGYRYLSEGSFYERLLWFFIHLISLISVIYLNVYMWGMFITDPTIVTLEKFTLPIREVEFPAVSICNINKISRKAAVIMARQYALNSTYDEDEILENLRLLGKMYDFSFSTQDEEKLMEFQAFLEKNDPDPKINDKFDMMMKLKRLTGTCEEMLSFCRWNGRYKDCSELFVLDVTADGFCCTFNLDILGEKGETQSQIIKENDGKILHSTKFGRDYGLTFTVTTNLSDSFYSAMATVGTKILFSRPVDYPDTTTGGTAEKLLPIGVEANLELSAQSIYTVQEARKYSADKRKCIFEDEHKTFSGVYSLSNCMLQCKILSILALCECVNFIHMQDKVKKYFYQCSLSDLSCLSKYIAKWRQYNPEDYVGKGLEREKQDSLLCPQCYPECNTVRYFINTEYGDIAGSDLNFSVVNIYFETPYVEQLKQDVVYYWFDMISKTCVFKNCTEFDHTHSIFLSRS